MAKKVGVVLCTCGGKLKEKIDFDSIKSYLKKVEGVKEIVITDDLCVSPYEKLSCLKGKVDGIVFGGCSERSSLKFNEDIIEKTLVSLGIDPSFYEVVNLREQCFYIHDDLEGIDRKIKDSFSMALEKLKSNIPSYEEKIKEKVLIVGGGIAGQRCAQALADLGIESTIVEEKPYLGGKGLEVALFWQSESSPSFCTTDCVVPVVGRDTLLRREKIKVLTSSQVINVEKKEGKFVVKIERKPLYVDPNKCVSCGECSKVCPVEVPNPYNLGKTKIKAIDKPLPLAIPDYYTIDEEACTKCGKCEEVCPQKAINLNAKEETIIEEFGSVVIATGFTSYDMKVFENLSYGEEGVLTLREFERYLANGLFKESPKEVSFVLCLKDKVGYCSRITCNIVIKQAFLLKRNNRNVKVRIFAKELRTTGRAFEEFRSRAKKLGVEFVEEAVEKVERKERKLEVATTNSIYTSDLVVLAEPLVPQQVKISKMLDLQLDKFGFPLEFQPRVINPLETFVKRVFVIGGAKGFKDVQESIESALGGAVRVYKALKGERKKYYSTIDQDKCSRCETCLSCCPHGAITITKDEKVFIDPSLCRGCGLCYPPCPSKAIRFNNLEDEQILRMAKVAFRNLEEGKPRVLAFLCYWCAYGAADLMGIKHKEKLPENFRTIRVRCSASLSLDVIAKIFEEDLADGIVVAGCPVANCHHVFGNYMQERRIETFKEMLELIGVKNKIVRWEYIGVPQGKKLAEAIREVSKALEVENVKA